MFVSMRDEDKSGVVDAVKSLETAGFTIIATGGTQKFLEEQGIAVKKINKVLEGRPHIVDAIKNGEVQLVFNTTEGAQAISDSRSMRRAALLNKVPYYTTLAGSVAAAKGITAHKAGSLEVRPFTILLRLRLIYSLTGRESAPFPAWFVFVNARSLKKSKMRTQ